MTRMQTGTLWHTWLQQRLVRLGVPVMCEVNLNPWLPEGWGGTADFVIWNPELRAFVLVDLKTTKGESLRYVQDGAKEEHIWQTSAYWYALKKMGLPMVKREAVFYLPMNDTRGDEPVEPVLIDFEPLPARTIGAEMKSRAKSAAAYVDSIDPEGADNPHKFLTDKLAPVQERSQRIYYDRKTGTWELKWIPHWSAQFCPYKTELCDCSVQGTTKLGTFDVDGAYYPRREYADIEPEVFPN
jgi:hypothetical protein